MFTHWSFLLHLKKHGGGDAARVEGRGHADP